MVGLSRFTKGAMAAVVALAAVACSPEGPQGPFEPPAALITPSPTGQNLNVFVCKTAFDPTDGTLGDLFDFTVASDLGTNFSPQDVVAQDLLALDPTLCALAWQQEDTEYNDETEITITEDVPAGYRLVQISFQGTGVYPGCETTGDVQPCVPTDIVDEVNGVGPAVTLVPIDGLTVFFKNILVEEPPPPPPPPGDEGCTPGYWKNHLDSWVPTGYAPGDLVSSVFTGTLFGTATLHQALSFGGGPGVAGAQQILLRAAVAGLLNASHPDVAYTTSATDLIDAVNAAIASGDRDTMLALAADIDADNNLGCPLN